MFGVLGMASKKRSIAPWRADFEVEKANVAPIVIGSVTPRDSSDDVVTAIIPATPREPELDDMPEKEVKQSPSSTTSKPKTAHIATRPNLVEEEWRRSFAPCKTSDNLETNKTLDKMHSAENEDDKHKSLTIPWNESCMEEVTSKTLSSPTNVPDAANLITSSSASIVFPKNYSNLKKKRSNMPWKTDSNRKAEYKQSPLMRPDGASKTMSKTTSRKSLALVRKRSTSCVTRLVSLIDDGFENPDSNIIRQRMETLLLIGALVFSMVTSLMAAVTAQDFNDTLKAQHLNNTVRELAAVNLDVGHFYYNDIIKHVVSNRIPNYIKYAQENQDNLDAFFENHPHNIFHAERKTYQRNVINAEVCVLLSFFETGVCFFTFNHTRLNSKNALKTWYRFSAVFIYFSLYLLLVSIAFFNMALVSSMAFKGAAMDNWVDFVLISEFVHTVPAPVIVLISFLGMIVANRNANRGIIKSNANRDITTNSIVFPAAVNNLETT